MKTASTTLLTLMVVLMHNPRGVATESTPDATSGAVLAAQPTAKVPATRVLSRGDYRDKLRGFWLGACIGNWTGLVTEMDKVGVTADHDTGPFYTRDDWGGPDQPSIWSEEPSPLSPTIDYVLRGRDELWGADDDTDIEYMYQHLMLSNRACVLSPQQIRDGWLRHIRSEEENYLWVSNERAYRLMEQGLLPPATSSPELNDDFDMIDAQLTTEIFGLFAPTRPDVAKRMAHLPIRTTARQEAARISEFYVTMHALAALHREGEPLSTHLQWSASKAREALPDDSYAAKMHDYVREQYASGVAWERTRDALYQKYQLGHEDGYDMTDKPCAGCFAAGINFAASLVSLYYGEGNLQQTIQIGTLAGWDSDNPTATWAGLLGFLYGREAIEQAFGQPLSDRYHIHRTRRAFPAAIDDFSGMASRGVAVVDMVVREQMAGTVDLVNDRWIIPVTSEAAE